MLYVELKGRCPAIGCGDNKIAYWKHASCGGSSRLNINQKAMLKCSDCGKQYSVFDSRWACQLHEGDYKKGDLFRLQHAISLVIDSATNLGNLEWQDEIMDVFEEMRQKEKAERKKGLLVKMG